MIYLKIPQRKQNLALSASTYQPMYEGQHLTMFRLELVFIGMYFGLFHFPISSNSCTNLDYIVDYCLDIFSIAFINVVFIPHAYVGNVIYCWMNDGFWFRTTGTSNVGCVKRLIKDKKCSFNVVFGGFKALPWPAVSVPRFRAIMYGHVCSGSH